MPQTSADEATDLENLFKRYRSAIERYLLRRGCNPYEVEDVCQETFMRAWNAIIRGEEIIPTTARHAQNWLYKIARHAAIDTYRHNKLLESVPLTEEVQLDEDAEERTLKKLWLKEAIAELPPKYQKAFVLRYQEGYSQQDAATQLNTEPSTVSANACRGKEKLRQKYYQVTTEVRAIDTKTALRQSGLSCVTLINTHPASWEEKQFGNMSFSVCTSKEVEDIAGYCMCGVQSLLEMDDDTFKQEVFGRWQLDWTNIRNAIAHPERYRSELELPSTSNPLASWDGWEPDLPPNVQMPFGLEA